MLHHLNAWKAIYGISERTLLLPLLPQTKGRRGACFPRPLSDVPGQAAPNCKACNFDPNDASKLLLSARDQKQNQEKRVTYFCAVQKSRGRGQKIYIYAPLNHLECCNHLNIKGYLKTLGISFTSIIISRAAH